MRGGGAAPYSPLDPEAEAEDGSLFLRPPSAEEPMAAMVALLEGQYGFGVRSVLW